MNAADLKQIRQVIKEEVTTVVKEEVTKIVAASEEKIITEVANFISEDVLPQIDEKTDKSDIERIERKVDQVLDKLYDHESRIKDIERIPVIAHELKLKKSK